MVGPYETVTLRSSDPKALTVWLTKNGYAIHPGADSTLPLRMVAAGVGAEVALTLFVIGEGRYHTQNFPDAVWKESELFWDTTQNRSNYTELALSAMAQQSGRAWLTEYAQRAIPDADGYTEACMTELGIEGLDAGELSDPDAEADASAPPAARDKCDDIAVAKRHLQTIWITRLRGNLPVKALSEDLKLEPTRSQDPVSNVHVAQSIPGDALTSGSSCALASGDAGAAAEAGACVLALASLLRRRRR